MQSLTEALKDIKSKNVVIRDNTVVVTCVRDFMNSKKFQAYETTCKMVEARLNRAGFDYNCTNSSAELGNWGSGREIYTTRYELY